MLQCGNVEKLKAIATCHPLTKYQPFSLALPYPVVLLTSLALARIQANNAVAA